MTIHSETALRNFGFWSGAKDRADMLTFSQLDAIETELEQLYADGIGETELNDLFWFDFDFVCSLIGTSEAAVFGEEEEGEEEKEEQEDENHD